MDRKAEKRKAKIKEQIRKTSCLNDTIINSGSSGWKDQWVQNNLHYTDDESWVCALEQYLVKAVPLFIS